MRRFSLLVVLALLPSSAFAADPDAAVTRDPRTGRTISVRVNGPAEMALNGSLSPEHAAQGFLKKHGAAFGLADPGRELVPSKMHKDGLGISHVRYNQTVEGVPVFGAQLLVHVEKSGDARIANGDVLPHLTMDVTPTLSAADAVKAAQEVFAKQYGQPGAMVAADLAIFSPMLLGGNSSSEARLTWRVELVRRPQHEFYFIDAHDGSLVKRLSGKRDIARVAYDCSVGGGNCGLDYFAGYSYIFGRSEGQPARGMNPWKPAGYARDVDTSYDAVGWSFLYYLNRFGLNGANGAGGMGDGINAAAVLTPIFDYIDDYDSSSCPNAWFDGYSVNFCQGLVHQDIVSHEYQHAVTQFAIRDVWGPAGLTYSGESGALNEAYSDIFGVAVERYAGVSEEWVIGEAIPEIVVRSLANPAQYSYELGPYPDRFYSPTFYCGSGDEGGVHINSGVAAHAAYLAAMGGTFNGCSISGIGRDAQENIFYRALTTYMIPSTNFNGAYLALIWACRDLYSADVCWELEKALKAVEMDQPGRCSGVPAQAPNCAAPDSIPGPAPRLGAPTTPRVSLKSKRATIRMQSINGATRYEVEFSKGGVSSIRNSRSSSYRSAKLKKGTYSVRYRVHTAAASPATDYSAARSFRVK